jgi:hypothetical protein
VREYEVFMKAGGTAVAVMKSGASGPGTLLLLQDSPNEHNRRQIRVRKRALFDSVIGSSHSRIIGAYGADGAAASKYREYGTVIEKGSTHHRF